MRNRKFSLASLFIYLVCLLLFSAFAYYYAHVDRLVLLYDHDQDNVDTTGELIKGQVIEQSFQAQYDGLTAITILFGTYDRDNTAQYQVELYNAADQRVFQGSVDSSVIQDNQELTIDMNKIADSKDKVYRLQITTPDAQGGNAITIYTYPAVDPLKHLLISGQDTGRSLAVKCLYQFFDRQTIIVLIYFALVICGFIIYIYKFI